MGTGQLVIHTVPLYCSHRLVLCSIRDGLCNDVLGNACKRNGIYANIGLIKHGIVCCVRKVQIRYCSKFPRNTCFGTIGFIVAMWAISLLGLELSKAQLYIASGASLALALYSLTLPSIPVVKKKGKQGWVSLLGLEAFVLFKKPKMAIFFLFSMLLGVVLQITNTFGNPFLHDFGLNPEFAGSLVVKYPSILLSVSQIAEVFFILAIPFFLKNMELRKLF